MSAVPPEGTTDATWAVIGEAPGFHEDQEGRPFVGKSGQLLRDNLARVGLDPATGWITNVVKERPPSNRTPTTKEIKEAIPSLVEELRALPNLKYVLLVGGVPLQAITGLTGVMKHRGMVKGRRKEAAGTEELTFFSTIHPAAVLRNDNYFNGWLQDLAAFSQLVQEKKEYYQVLHVTNRIGYEAFKLSVQPTGALDIETTIGDPFREDVKLVSVAVTFDGYRAFVFSGDDEWLRRAKSTLESVGWIMHNGYFDVMMMRQFGYNLHLKHDTMAMAYLLHENERKSLEVLSSVWLGLPPYKDVDYQSILDEPIEKVIEMNGKDALRTYSLFRPLADAINANPDTSRTYQWLLLPAIHTLIRVTETGVPLDLGRLSKLTTDVAEKVVGLEATLLATVPEPDPDVYPKGWPNSRFNPQSPKQVAHVLYDQWKYPVLQYTDTGQPSTSEDVLRQLEAQTGNEWLSTLINWRGWRKILSSYLESWPGLADRNGYLHPRYKPLFVVTGRLSSENPNIQNVPRNHEIRDVFGGVPGYTWVKADYSQIELRIAAWLAKEPVMLQSYRSGLDLHMVTAKRVLGQETRSARQVAKTLNFGLLYGAGPGTLQRVARNDFNMDISDEEARMYHGAFFSAYPQLKQWHKDMERTIKRTGQSVSPLGRVRHLPDAQSTDPDLAHKAVREGINHPVQSFASDMLLMNLSRVEARLEGTGAKIIAEVHDEMDLLVPDNKVDEVVRIVKETMEDTSWLGQWGIELTVPVVVEITTGTHWGSLKERE